MGTTKWTALLRHLRTMRMVAISPDRAWHYADGSLDSLTRTLNFLVDLGPAKRWRDGEAEPERVDSVRHAHRVVGVRLTDHGHALAAMLGA